MKIYLAVHAKVCTLTSGLQNEVYGISASLSLNLRPKNSTISGYATVDVNAFWNVNPNVKLFTNIQNIGDVEYKTTSYGSWILLCEWRSP